MFDLLAALSLPDYEYLLAAGLVLGTGLSILLARPRHSPLVVFDGSLAAAAGGLVAGRVVYVAANGAYFGDHLGEAIAFWRGGLSAVGVLVGALAGVWVLCRWRRIDLRALLDALTPGAAVVVIGAWLACLEAGCACGVATRPDQDLLWGLSADLPDLYGIRSPRVAVQILGAGWGSVVLALVLLIRRPGRTFPLWLLLYAVGDAGLAFLRGDLMPPVPDRIVVQAVDLLLIGVAAVMLVFPKRASAGRVE